MQEFSSSAWKGMSSLDVPGADSRQAIKTAHGEDAVNIQHTSQSKI